MNSQQRYFYRKKDKLKSRKIMDSLFAKGHSFSNFPLKVIWLPGNMHSQLQAGMGVSTRNFKKAVDRNRVKRLMREGYRLQKSILEQWLSDNGQTMSVFFLYNGKELPTYEDVLEKFGVIMNRLIKFANEQAQKNN